MVTLRDIQRSVSQSVKQTTDGQATLDLIDTFLGEQAAEETSTGSPAIAQSPAGASDAAVDRLSSEILQLCNSLVLSNDTVALVSSRPEAVKVHSQHYLILRFVRQLLPVLCPRRIFDDWWQPVLRPILTTASYVDQVKQEACTIISDCLILEKDDDKYAKMIIEEYLAWSEKPQELDDTAQLRLQHQVLLDLEQDEWSRNLIAILLSFGAAETKKFFMLMNHYFLLSKHRLQIVYLLSEFLLKKEGTHLHEILETDLFSSMLKSLMYDNSTTLIAMSVTNLIMLLPRICTSLPPYLPQLFYIFARALCWEQLRDMRQKHGIQSPNKNTPAQATRTSVDGWDCVDYTFSKLSAPPSNPQTGPLFTSLYGLYPCNFLKFLHNPYAYFQENNFTIPEEFDEETFRNRTLNLVKRHMLHPNLLTMDPETELSDRSRWMTTEAEGVITQIMSLDLTNAASRVGFSSKTEQDQPQDLLDETVYTQPFIKTEAYAKEEEQDVKERVETQKLEQQDKNKEEEEEDEKEEDAPSTPKQDKQNDPVVIGNILKMHRALKSGAEVLVGDDVWEAELQQFSSPSPTASPPPVLDSVSLTAAAAAAASNVGSPLPSVPETNVPDVDGLSATSVSPETKLLIAALKREVLLLRNELNFELFVKQQYLQHMARLHRDHVFDSSVEAERQRMYNTTRILRAQLEQATTALDKLKTESAMTKQRRIRWEDAQSGKVQSFRDEKKKWRVELEELKQKLAEYEQQLSDQSKELLEAQKRVFDLENELKTCQPLVQKAAEYEIRVTQLTRQMLLWEEDTAQLEEQKRYIKGLLSEWFSREELVSSLQSENSRLEQELSKLRSDNKEMERLLTEYQEQAKQMVHDKFEAKLDVGKSQSKQLEQLKSTVQELKNRLEILEIEKFEWEAERERLNHAQTSLAPEASDSGNPPADPENAE